MEKFSEILGAEILIRTSGGSYRVLPLYAREGFLYVGFGKGYLRILPGFNSIWPTSNPKVVVVDYTRDVPGLDFSSTYPKYEEPK